MSIIPDINSFYQTDKGLYFGKFDVKSVFLSEYLTTTKMIPSAPQKSFTFIEEKLENRRKDTNIFDTSMNIFKEEITYVKNENKKLEKTTKQAKAYPKYFKQSIHWLQFVQTLLQ